MMKKKTALFLCLALVGSLLLSGCSSNLPKGYTAFPKGGDGTGVDTPETVEGGLKLGMAVGSDALGSTDGQVVVNSYLAAVLTDQSGVITNCNLDKLVTTVDISADGKLVQDRKTQTYQSVRAGGDNAWAEAADAFAAAVVGKTADEVRALAGQSPEEGAAALVAKAAESAQNRGAKVGDTLGVGIFGNLDNSMDARSSGNGNVSAYNSYAAVSFGSDGRITSIYLDGSDASVEFEGSGKLANGPAFAKHFATKNEEGDEYGLAQYSGIGREYYQQALEYAAYATGKTVEEVTGIALTDHGAPDGVADLTASVSISVNEYNRAILEAASNAK